VESSTKGDRHKFLDMVKFAGSQKEVIAIVADKVDRVQRSFREYPLLDDLVQRGKIELHFNTENYVIHKDSMSQERLMWSMGVIMAQSYVDSMKDNIRRSFDQKIRLGEYVSLAPIGYLNQRDERDRGIIVIDPERAPLVIKLFQEYATGQHTLAEMTDKAKTWGLRNRIRGHNYIQRSHIEITT
jgi:DNA invertase Pin-like site-specific DNA recombinase